jgi:hypothetical protein
MRVKTGRGWTVQLDAYHDNYFFEAQAGGRVRVFGPMTWQYWGIFGWVYAPLFGVRADLIELNVVWELGEIPGYPSSSDAKRCWSSWRCTLEQTSWGWHATLPVTAVKADATVFIRDEKEPIRLTENWRA